LESSTPSSRSHPDAQAAEREGSDVPQWRRERLKRAAYLLDDAFRIPGTQRRVGFDALIGLVPGVGDAAGALASSYILYEGARLGVSLATLFRMALNIAVEALVGLIPGLGDLFDFAFKANNRNVRLVERHLENTEATRRSSRTVLTTAAIGLTLLILALIAGGVWAVVALVNVLGGAA
jgi:hypothetical protein